MATPREQANRDHARRTWKINPAKAAALEYQRGLGRAAVAEAAVKKAHTASATRNGVTWWIGLDRAALNRIANERHPTCEGKLPQPNF